MPSPRFILPGALALAVAFGAASCARAPATLNAAESATVARPVVLVVHGRGHRSRDSVEVRRSAHAALASGLRSHGVTPEAMLAAGDVRVVWYADIEANRGAAGAACERQDTLAGNAEPEISLVAGIVGALLDVVGEAANAPELREFRDDVRFVADRSVQCAAEQRLHAEILRASREGRPIVILAHSLGALVSWGYFNHLDPAQRAGLPEIASFITVGSPLGSPDIRAMVFGRAGPALQVPDRVRRWINVVDADDPFATPIGTGRAAANADPRQSDVWTTLRRSDPHRLEGYLRDPAGAAAVLSGWCDAVHRVPAAMRDACART